MEEGDESDMPESELSLEEIREHLGALNVAVFERWIAVSGPHGEWDDAGCECARTGLSDLMIENFAPANKGGCGNTPFLTMLTWTLLSASEACRI